MYFGSGYLSGHTYSLAASGLKKNIEKQFVSRAAATEYMYTLLAKYHLHIIEVYDDKHDKTYKCNDDIKFYIQRLG